MVTRLLVVDDQLWKYRVLSGAVATRGSDTYAVEIATLDELFRMTDAELAVNDVLLVDFQLGVERTHGVVAPPMMSVTFDGSRHEVEVTTGMGVLIHLHERFRAAGFRDAREAHGTMPRVLAYVPTNEVPSQLFATAVAWWFGVRNLPVTDATEAAGVLAQLEHLLGGQALVKEAIEIRRVGALHLLMSSLAEHRFKGFGPHGRQVRRWLATYPDYVSARGSKGEGTRAHVLRSAGLITDARIQDTSIAGVLQAMYGPARQFAAHWPREDDGQWAAAYDQDRNGAREFLAFVQKSHVFWTQPDVEVAHRLWAHGNLDRLGPVRLPRELDRWARGSRGDHVARIQAALNRAIGAGLEVDGRFGALTEEALVSYQRFLSIIPADGVFAAETRDALEASPLWPGPAGTVAR